MRLAGDAFVALLPERRALLWHGMGVRLMNHRVWLHNKGSAPLLAHDIFRWLLRQAPKDGQNHALLVKNSRIGRYV